MTTVVYGEYPVYAYHKITKGKTVAISVDKDGEEVNIVFPENESEDRVFVYSDWLDLDYFEGK
jgi:hypothetical protein